jgi:hypothetical protein
MNEWTLTDELISALIAFGIFIIIMIVGWPEDLYPRKPKPKPNEPTKPSWRG